MDANVLKEAVLVRGRLDAHPRHQTPHLARQNGRAKHKHKREVVDSSSYVDKKVGVNFLKYSFVLHVPALILP